MVDSTTQLEQINQAEQDAILTRTQIENQKRQLEQSRLNIEQPRKRPAFTDRKTREAQRKYIQEDVPNYRQQLAQADVNLSNYQTQLNQSKAAVQRNIRIQSLYDRAKKYAESYWRGNKNAATAAGFLMKEGREGNKAYKYYVDYLDYLYGKSAEPNSGVAVPTQLTAITDANGNLLGYEDPIQNISRDATAQEILYYKINHPTVSAKPAAPNQDYTYQPPEILKKTTKLFEPQPVETNKVKATVVEIPVYDKNGNVIRVDRALVKEDNVQPGISQFQTAKYTDENYKKFLEGTKEIRLIAGGFVKLATEPLTPVYDEIFNVGRFPEQTTTQAKVYRGGLAATKFGILESNPVTGIPTTVFYGAKAVEQISADPLAFTGNLLTGIFQEPFEFAGAIAGGTAARSAYGNVRTILQGDSTVAKVESLSRDVQREPYTRARATIIIRDSNGRYLLGIDKNSGNYITFGGKIETGQTARQAILAELSQETGLTLKDINSIKATDRITTPRDDYFVYEIKLKEGADTRIRPGSDVRGFSWIKANEKYTGPSTLFPVGQPTKLVFGRKIRPEDSYLISRTNELHIIDKTISSLNKETRLRLLEEAKTVLSKRFGQNKLKGITDKQLLRDYLLFKKKLLPTQLYIKSSKGNLLVSPTSRYDIPVERQIEFTKQTFKKKVYSRKVFISKADINDYLTPNYNKFIITKGKGYRKYQKPQLLTTLTSETIKPESISDFITGKRKVFGEKTKRGETPGIYTSPPTFPGSKVGYAPLTYLGEGSEGGLGFGFRKYGTPQVYVLKAKISGEIYRKGFTLEQINQYVKSRTGPVAEFYRNAQGKGVVPTPKSLRSGELETVVTPNTIFKVSGKKKTFYLGGRRIQQREIKIAKVSKDVSNRVRNNLNLLNKRLPRDIYNQVIRELKQDTGIDYSTSKRNIEVTPNILSRERRLNVQKSREVIIKEKPTSRAVIESLILPERKVSAPKSKELITIQERRFSEVITGEPKSPPRNPREPKSPPNRQFNSFIIRGKPEEGNRRKRPKKKKRTRTRYQTLPTVFEQLTFGGPKSKKPLVRITGAEIFRFA